MTFMQFVEGADRPSSRRQAIKLVRAGFQQARTHMDGQVVRGTDYIVLMDEDAFVDECSRLYEWIIPLWHLPGPRAAEDLFREAWKMEKEKAVQAKMAEVAFVAQHRRTPITYHPLFRHE